MSDEEADANIEMLSVRLHSRMGRAYSVEGGQVVPPHDLNSAALLLSAMPRICKDLRNLQAEVARMHLRTAADQERG